MTPVPLARELVPASGSASRRAAFVHGIFGSGANLRTLARRFVSAHPGWDAWLVDLRGHGASPRGAPSPSLANAAGDLAAAFAASELPVQLVVAHSFGAKVSLAAAGLAPAALPRLVALDAAPGARAPDRGPDSPLAVLELLRQLPGPFASRAAFADAVVAGGKSRTLAQWLATSVRLDPDGARFGLDLDEIEALLADHYATDLWPVVEDRPPATRLDLVIAERASAWPADERARADQLALRRPSVHVSRAPTGHWVHSEAPELVLALASRAVTD